MIDTFMVLWNRDRRRKGAKLVLTCLLVCFCASLLLGALYMPHLIVLPKRENFARDFINRTAATATVQAGQADLARKVSLLEGARAARVMPTSVVEPSCATISPASTLHALRRKHMKHDDVKKTGKKAHPRRGAQPSSHTASKSSSPLKVMPLPGSALRPTGSSTRPALTPTATHDASIVVVSTPTATPGGATNVTTTTSANAGDPATMGATPVPTATVASDMAKGQRVSNESVPHLQHGGGPVFDDSSIPANDVPYAAWAANDASQAMHRAAVSCLRRDTLEQSLP
jgi:hypothetical protein